MMCITYLLITHHGTEMRTNIEIDDTLMSEAQKALGQPTKKKP